MIRWIAVFLLSFTTLQGDDLRPVTDAVPIYNEPILPSETEMLDTLIISTEKQLAEIKKLREQVAKYIVLQKKYEQNTTDKQLAARIVRGAHVIYKKIRELELTQAFDQKFLSELAFFSNIADKQKG